MHLAGQTNRDAVCWQSGFSQAILAVKPGRCSHPCYHT